MIERLQAIEARYNEITEELMKPENISDIDMLVGYMSGQTR